MNAATDNSGQVVHERTVVDSDAIRINWYVDILSGNGEVFHGRLSRVGTRWVEVLVDRNLYPGQQYDLVLMPPKGRSDEAETIIKGRGVVHVSVHAAMRFHVTLVWLEVKGNGEAFLNDYISKCREGI